MAIDGNAKIRILNVVVDNLTLDEAVDKIDQMVLENNSAYVVTPNLDHLVMLDKNSEFQEVYEHADLVLTDGMPLVWLSKIYGRPVKEKVSGSDLFPRVAKMAAAKGYSLYFLGAGEGIAQKAAENLCKKNPELNVVGTYSPPLGFENDKREIDKIVTKIQDVHPDILVVGLGAPKQEVFLYRYRERLNVPVSLGLGASLDFEANMKKRAPVWVSQIGLEWLYRLLQEPKRLFGRYFRDGISLLPLMIKYRN